MSNMSLRSLLFTASLAVVPGTSFSATVEELIAKHIEARGGAEMLGGSYLPRAFRGLE